MRDNIKYFQGAAENVNHAKTLLKLRVTICFGVLLVNQKFKNDFLNEAHTDIRLNFKNYKTSMAYNFSVERLG